MNLLDKIKEEYELCINYPHEYKEKVDSISTLLRLNGKNMLLSDICPVYIVGRYQTSPFISFGINPGYSDVNNPSEEKVARVSWKTYQDLYQNFFSFFNTNGFESPYYTSLWYLLTGVKTNSRKFEIRDKWKFFEENLTNMELIPYHSKGIILSSMFDDNQLHYLVQRFKENIDFIINYKPKLFIFNGSPWHSLLIKNKMIIEFERVPVTNKFNIYFFKVKGISSILFDKFFQRHFWV